MKSIGVPAALREKLGDTGSIALADMLDTHTRESIDYAVEKSAERFERRIVEETSKLRVDMAEMRRDLSDQIASSRFDLVKWSFAFWMGQLLAIIGILSVMLRGVR